MKMSGVHRPYLPATIAVAVVALVGLALDSSCAVDGFVLVDGAAGSPSATASTSGTAGASEGGAGGAAACVHETWPAPPASADPGTNSVDFVVAARSFDFGNGDLSEGPAVGYDLDNLCSCQGQDFSCREPAWATADHCDGPGGRDNAIAQLFHQIGMFDDDFTSAHYTESAELGRNTILIRVRNYNGRANDDQITVSVHPSQGLDEEPCLATGTVPAWDGTDPWPIHANSLEVEPGTGGSGAGGGPACGNNGYDPDAARYVDDNAYVTEGVMVANLPRLSLAFIADSEPIPVELVAGFVTGRLEQQGTQWYVREGLVVGRWEVTEFFRMIGNTSDGGPLCTNHDLYPLLKSAACQFPDIAAQLSGPTTPCDAYSFGMAFEGHPALFGSVLPPVSTESPCAPDVDPQYDTCG
ncbi:MAG: hypothetical protein JRI23_09825 [Deltaproteobacteria bacterium]|nr:hypothetical protein [Deltaproteobacteria bacterium]MBW2531966.1 hypothetical protein [Deltaproteobacteria bacterium]